MEIKIGMGGEVVIVDLNGELVASTAEDFKAQIAKLRDKNFRYILVEMSKVRFMDSSGLGACMVAHKMLNEKNGMVVWAKPSEAVRKVYRITRADQKLRIAATKQEGLNSLHEATVAGRTT